MITKEISVTLRRFLRQSPSRDLATLGNDEKEHITYQHNILAALGIIYRISILIGTFLHFPRHIYVKFR